MRIATFNVQNLRLRQTDGRAELDPARDGDMDSVAPDAQHDIAQADRRLTADLLVRADADIVALQEVFDQATLDHFHDAVAVPCGLSPYPFRVCTTGNDGRGLNVACMSRHAPESVHSHSAETGRDLDLDGIPEDLRDRPLFRRDCLEIIFGSFVLYICHFKAPYPDRDRAHAVRHAEARGVRRIVERRFDNPASARWIILGDFNEPGQTGTNDSAIAPLLDGFATDIAARDPRDGDWTLEVPDTHAHTRPDRILLSPALARGWPDAHPRVIRSPDAAPVVAGQMAHASDHALIYADFPGLEGTTRQERMHR